MNNIIISADRTGAPLEVDASPTPLRLPNGSALFAYQGDLWITQEGMRDDWILRPGERFDVKGRGLILVSATRRGIAHLVVVPPPRLHSNLFGRAVESAWQLLRQSPGASVSHHMPARFVRESGH
jgi:hypothetical protein